MVKVIFKLPTIPPPHSPALPLLGQVFPRLTKCTFYRFGAGGSLERFDALCVLSINVVNDKIYLTVWFWYIALIALGR